MEWIFYLIVAPILILIFTLLFINAMYGALDNIYGDIVELIQEIVSRAFGRG